MNDETNQHGPGCRCIEHHDTIPAPPPPVMPEPAPRVRRRMPPAVALATLAILGMLIPTDRERT